MLTAIRFTKTIFVIASIVFILSGCEEEAAARFDYFDIDAQLTNLMIGGYDGYFITDWNIINNSDQTLDGWEITVRVITASYQHETGIFFRHDVNIAPGDTIGYTNNILFHRDTENLYPITLSVPDTTLRVWDILSVQGLIID